MKKTLFYFGTCFFLLGTGASVSAQSSKIYSATELPTQQGWQELKLDGDVTPVAGDVSGTLASGVLKLKSDAAGKFTQLGWYKTGLGLDLGTGYTIEIKAKVTDASKYGAFNIQGYDNEGKGFRLGIYKNYLTEWTNPLAATNVLKDGLTNDDGFHVYRLAVAPSGTVTLYRDAVEIGTFPISAFYFDNIIENGGFEDGEGDDPSYFPDFQSNGIMYRTSEKKGENPIDDWEVKSGDYALVFDNNDLTEDGITNSERARTRDIPVKPGTKYDISISRRRLVEPYAWRDMGAFYDYQLGTQDGVDDRNHNALWASANDNFWQIHNQTITTPAEDADEVANSLRFEFPSWLRDGVYTSIKTAFDDFVFRENLGLKVGPKTVGASKEPVFPEGYANLITNGGFEDHETNNDGTPYLWKLSNPDDLDSNDPTDWNELWKGEVRIQDRDKPNDEVGGQWAHSGTSSLRFSTLGNHGELDFVKELEPDKTYRFNFWHRNPHWPEGAWVNVKIAGSGSIYDPGTIIWGDYLNNNQNAWMNADMVFTTTATNYYLHLYIDPDSYKEWYNIYFDDLVLYEVTDALPYDPQLVGKTNLFTNGDFEDITKDNDNKAYEWALASTNGGFPEGDNALNYPVKWNDQWGTYVRLQDIRKFGDTGFQWAHSGTKSLRFSFLDDKGKAQEFEGITDGLEPKAFRVNMNMNKELEPNKTYTFVFWVKTANYNDKGRLIVTNGNMRLWEQELSAHFIDWNRQSITFRTSERNRTLKMFTEFTGWFNFYLDDIFLYEETADVPVIDGDSYLFFGKSTGTQSTDVEIEYVSVFTTGAYAPGEEPNAIDNPAATQVKNLKVYASQGQLTVNTLTPAPVYIYDIAGRRVAQLNVKASASITLPQGVYIVKSASEVVKVVNK